MFSSNNNKNIQSSSQFSPNLVSEIRPYLYASREKALSAIENLQLTDGTTLFYLGEKHIELLILCEKNISNQEVALRIKEPLFPGEIFNLLKIKKNNPINLENYIEWHFTIIIDYSFKIRLSGIFLHFTQWEIGFMTFLKNFNWNIQKPLEKDLLPNTKINEFIINSKTQKENNDEEENRKTNEQIENKKQELIHRLINPLLLKRNISEVNPENTSHEQEKKKLNQGKNQSTKEEEKNLDNNNNNTVTNPQISHIINQTIYHPPKNVLENASTDVKQQVKEEQEQKTFP